MNELLKQVFSVDRRASVAYWLTALFFGGILAFVYTYMGGPSLVTNDVYSVYDSMLFVFGGLLSLPFAGLMYYFTRDVSLSLAPVVGAVVSLVSGFEDVMVYVFCTVRQSGACGDVTGLPGTWPWLEGHPYIMKVSSLLGADTVTDLGIVIASVLALLVGFVFVKILDNFDPEGYPRL